MVLHHSITEVLKFILSILEWHTLNFIMRITQIKANYILVLAVQINSLRTQVRKVQML